MAKIVACNFGGLGNQLFCYAGARRLALANRAVLVIGLRETIVSRYVLKQSSFLITAGNCLIHAKGYDPPGKAVSLLNLKTAVESVARRTRLLKIRDKIEKYSAAVAHRYGEERFFDFVVQFR